MGFTNAGAVLFTLLALHDSSRMPLGSSFKALLDGDKRKRSCCQLPNPERTEATANAGEIEDGLDSPTSSSGHETRVGIGRRIAVLGSTFDIWLSLISLFGTMAVLANHRNNDRVFFLQGVALMVMLSVNFILLLAFFRNGWALVLFLWKIFFIVVNTAVLVAWVSSESQFITVTSNVYISLLAVYTVYMIFLVVALGRMSRTKRQYGSGRRFKRGGISMHCIL